MLRIVVGLVVVAAAAILYGEFCWKSSTRELRHRLEAARLPIEPKVSGRDTVPTVRLRDPFLK